MKRAALLGAAAALCWATVARAATYDLSGEWSYTISGLQVTGVCPLGQGGSGKLLITQNGDSFTLALLTGVVCDPLSMCSFSGTVSGAQYSASNSAVVDDEGGTTTNTLSFTAMSATVASGGGTSVYQHPQGMSCTWTKNITMTRTGSNGSDVPDGSGGIPGPDGGTANSDGGGAGDKDGGGCHLAATPTGAAGLLPLVFLLLALGRRRR